MPFRILSTCLKINLEKNTFLHVELIYSVVSILIKDVMKYTVYNIIP